MKKIILTSIFIVQTLFMFAQNVQILPTGITPAQGGGIDRMTTNQRNALSNQLPGKIVFDLDKGYLYVWNGYQWHRIEQGTTDTSSNVPVFASDSTSGDQFGYDVAIEGEWAVIGAPGKRSGGGETYVYRKTSNGWQEFTKLRSISTVEDIIDGNDSFGFSVAISNFTYTLNGKTLSVPIIVVGAPKCDGITNSVFQGVAFVFRWNGTTWLHDATLTAAVPSTNDEFGYDVSISKGLIAVGAPSDDIGAVSNAGSVTVFRNLAILSTLPPSATWNRVSQTSTGNTTLVDVGVATDNYFGFSVSIDGTNLAVGIPKNYTDDYGTVLVFYNGPDYSTNPRAFNYTNLDNIDIDSQLGWSVSLSEQNLLIGVPFDDLTNPAASQAGTAHLVHWTNISWAVGTAFTKQKFYSPYYDTSGNDTNFGDRVSIKGDYFIIGAYHHNATINEQNAIDVGLAIAYNFTSTSPLSATIPIIKIDIPKRIPGNQFGRGVAIDSGGDYIIGEAEVVVGFGGMVYFGNTHL